MSFSAFQLVSFSAFQLFSLSAFQLVSFSACQLAQCASWSLRACYLSRQLFSDLGSDWWVEAAWFCNLSLDLSILYVTSCTVSIFKACIGTAAWKARQCQRPPASWVSEWVSGGPNCLRTLLCPSYQWPNSPHTLFPWLKINISWRWKFIGRKHSGNKHHLLERLDNGNAHPPVEASTAPTALTVVASSGSTVEKS